MTNIFNPNPFEVAIERAHEAALAEDAFEGAFAVLEAELAAEERAEAADERELASELAKGA